MKAKYARSFLGPFWSSLTTLIGVVGLGYLWSNIFHIDQSTLLPSLTIGLVTWQLIAGCVSESTVAIIRQSHTIRNVKTPFLFFSWLVVAKSTINFFHNAVAIFIVLLIFPPKFGYEQLFFIPGFFILILNLLWIAAFISIISVRFRDVEPLITAALPILFFITPVIYKPEQLGSIKFLALINPFALLIAVIRDPIQGIIPPASIYVLSILMMVIGWMATIFLLNRVSKRMPFWV